MTKIKKKIFGYRTSSAVEKDTSTRSKRPFPVLLKLDYLSGNYEQG